MTLNTILDEMEARANAATAGPWRVDPETKDMAASVETDKKTIRIGAAYYDEADFAFIAAARHDVPALIRLARAQGEALERCREALDIARSVLNKLEYEESDKGVKQFIRTAADKVRALAAAAIDAEGILKGDA